MELRFPQRQAVAGIARPLVLRMQMQTCMTFEHRCIHTYGSYTHTHVYMYTYTRVYIHTYIHTQTLHARTQNPTPAPTRTPTQAPSAAPTPVCVHLAGLHLNLMHENACIYIYIYIYIDCLRSIKVSYTVNTPDLLPHGMAVCPRSR